MKYFFVLGRNKALSLAELFAFIPDTKRGKIINGTLLVADLSEEINANDLIKKLGGTIKLGLVVEENIVMYSAAMITAIKSVLQPSEGKYKFGISNYAKFASPSKDKRVAMNIKKYLKENNHSCRWVVGKERILSSVVVEQNLMKGRGLEIVVGGDYKKCFIGRTLAVQAFKDLAARDYGRPSRDDFSGMLPPKLAQIMINLSKAKISQSLLDPFCGSGTVISEAMLMGYKHLMASDLSDKAIADSQNNFVWIAKKFHLTVSPKVFKSDARQLAENIKKQSIDVIVTEPYLGPQRGKIDPDKLQKELSQLYTEAIRAFNKVLVPQGIIVMVWPIRKMFGKNFFLTPDLKNFQIIQLLSSELRKQYQHSFSPRGGIIYGREGQKVWREILVLKKRS